MQGFRHRRSLRPRMRGGSVEGALWDGFAWRKSVGGERRRGYEIWEARMRKRRRCLIRLSERVRTCTRFYLVSRVLIPYQKCSLKLKYSKIPLPCTGVLGALPSFLKSKLARGRTDSADGPRDPFLHKSKSITQEIRIHTIAATSSHGISTNSSAPRCRLWSR